MNDVTKAEVFGRMAALKDEVEMFEELIDKVSLEDAVDTDSEMSTTLDEVAGSVIGLAARLKLRFGY